MAAAIARHGTPNRAGGARRNRPPLNNGPSCGRATVPLHRFGALPTGPTMRLRPPCGLDRRRPPIVAPQRPRLQPPHLVEPRRRWLTARRRSADGEGSTSPAPHAAGSPALGMHPRTPDVARLEAALFVAREPLTLRRLAKLAGLPDASRARVLLRELQHLHDAEGVAFRVERIGGGFQLLTRSPLGPWVRRLLATPPETRVSTAALETLAIIAYRQPVTRAEIEAIRGVGSEEMLRQLLDRDLVAVGGRTDDLGRPHVYLTTRRFLQCFGLGTLDELPPVP